jgi:hypothetical protein
VPATSSSPTVLLDALAAAEVPSRPLSAAESISLLQALATVPDPRHRRGRRHSLQSILFLTLGAIVAGARSYAAIADWAAAGEQQVRVCADPPHASTFRRLLSRLDPVALQAALTGWVLTRRAGQGRRRPGRRASACVGRRWQDVARHPHPQGRGKVVRRPPDLSRYHGEEAAARRPAPSSRRRTNRRVALTWAGGEHPSCRSEPQRFLQRLGESASQDHRRSNPRF